MNKDTQFVWAVQNKQMIDCKESAYMSAIATAYPVERTIQ